MQMARLVRICLLASAALYGCSSTQDAGDTSSTVDSGSASTGASSAGSSRDSGSALDSAPLGTPATDVVPLNDPETDYSQTKTIAMAPFDVPANSEVFYCQTFANPWGKQVDIKTYDLNMDKGSHHMFAFYQSNATDASTSTPCANGGLTFGPFTFASQTPKAVETFPTTVGATVAATSGFNLMAHYLNTTTETITAHVSLTMYLAKDGVVTNHAGVMFLNNAAIKVPATGKPVVTTMTYTTKQDVNVMSAFSHMHKFATNFVATATAPGGKPETTYATTQWDEPIPSTFATPLHFASGTTFSWSCTDVNNTGTELTFGEYAQTNVMCISVYLFYPVQDVTEPVLGTDIGGL
jgi:hypothetical protein